MADIERNANEKNKKASELISVCARVFTCLPRVVPFATSCRSRTRFIPVAADEPPASFLFQLIGNCFWPSGALARSLTDRKSTSNRNDLARAVSIHQVPEFQILGL